MPVAEIMSTDVVSVGRDASLSDVGELMLDRRVGSVIVLEDAPLGIVTERDLIEVACATDRSLRGIPVAEAASEPLVTVEPGATIESALRRMREEGVKKLPVRDGLDLVGIVTLTDVALHLPEHVATVRRIESRRGKWTD